MRYVISKFAVFKLVYDFFEFLTSFDVNISNLAARQTKDMGYKMAFGITCLFIFEFERLDDKYARGRLHRFG